MLASLAWLLLPTIIPLKASAYPVLAVPGQPAFRLWPFNWTAPHDPDHTGQTSKSATITDLPNFTWSRPNRPPWLTTATDAANPTGTSIDLPNFTWSRPDEPPWLTGSGARTSSVKSTATLQNSSSPTITSTEIGTLAPVSSSPISIVPIADTTLDFTGNTTVTSIVTSIRIILSTGVTVVTTSTSLTALPISTSFSVEPGLTEGIIPIKSSTLPVNPIPNAKTTSIALPNVSVNPAMGTTVTRITTLTRTTTLIDGSTITRTATVTRTLTITGSPVSFSTPTSASSMSQNNSIVSPITSAVLTIAPSLTGHSITSSNLILTSSIPTISDLSSSTSVIAPNSPTIIIGSSSTASPVPATIILSTGSFPLTNSTITGSSTQITNLTPTATTTTSASSTNVANGFINAAYFINWGTYDRNYYPRQLPVDDLTHVFYAFAHQLPNGTITSSDPAKDAICVQQLKALKQDNPSLKVMLSIGGWNASQDGSFSTLASTDATRYIFASSAVHMMQEYGFDGVDIDWEYPENDADGRNFVLLLKEVRSALDILGSNYEDHHFLLTVAAPAGPAQYRHWRPSDMAKYVDFINFMGYDYLGAGFSKTSGHQANLYKSSTVPTSTNLETESAIDFYIASGIAPSKIILGMPLFGRSFDDTELGGAYTAPTTGSWLDSSASTGPGNGAGVWDYKALPKDGATEIYAVDAGATYSYDKSTRELVSYDTADQVGRKIDYILSMGLAGAYFWEASADRTDETSLIHTSATRLRAAGNLDTTSNIVL